jgi:putative ATPase
MADGDGRALLNLIEQVMAGRCRSRSTLRALGARLMRRAAQYDKSAR